MIMLTANKFPSLLLEYIPIAWTQGTLAIYSSDGNLGFLVELWVFLWASFYGEFSGSGEMESRKWTLDWEYLEEISLKKEGLTPVCGLMRYAEVVGLYEGFYFPQVNYLAISPEPPALSVCCWHNTIPRIEGTQEDFSSWHNSQVWGRKRKKC